MTNQIQLSRKNGIGKSFVFHLWGLKTKNFRIKGGLSFRLGPLKWQENQHYSRKKCHFRAEIYKFQSALISELATRWEISPIWACSAHRVLSEYTSHTPGSFLELDPLDEVSGCDVQLKNSDLFKCPVGMFCSSTSRINLSSASELTDYNIKIYLLDFQLHCTNSKTLVRRTFIECQAFITFTFG